jgi:Uma2 family endonuclease
MVVTISEAKKNPVGALLSNLTWETLEKLDADLAETGAQLTYLDGYLEIISPLSDAHEEPKVRFVVSRITVISPYIS